MGDIALLRLVAQRLAGPGLAGAAAAARWLTAAQAQDHGGAVTSVALRVAGGTRAAVEAAFAAGEVVKSWPLRGTLHLVAAEDLPWILTVGAPRVIAKAAARLTPTSRSTTRPSGTRASSPGRRWAAAVRRGGTSCSPGGTRPAWPRTASAATTSCGSSR